MRSIPKENIEIINLSPKLLPENFALTSIRSVDQKLDQGVGSPVPGGLSYLEAHLLMEVIAEFGCMFSLEVAEVNAVPSRKNQSALFAAELTASSMGQRII